jgi:hypothetical protein
VAWLRPVGAHSSAGTGFAIMVVSKPLDREGLPFLLLYRRRSLPCSRNWVSSTLRPSPTCAPTWRPPTIEALTEFWGRAAWPKRAGGALDTAVGSPL